MIYEICGFFFIFLQPADLKHHMYRPRQWSPQSYTGQIGPANRVCPLGQEARPQSQRQGPTRWASWYGTPYHTYVDILQVNIVMTIKIPSPLLDICEGNYSPTTGGFPGLATQSLGISFSRNKHTRVSGGFRSHDWYVASRECFGFVDSLMHFMPHVIPIVIVLQ